MAVLTRVLKGPPTCFHVFNQERSFDNSKGVASYHSAKSSA